MTGLDWMYMPTPTKPTQLQTTILEPQSTEAKPHQAPHLRPHPGHEAPWDSAIEDETHPLPHHQHHHHHHTTYASGASSPLSSHPASPGFEVPWDSPILPSTPLTPLSELDEKDYFAREAPAALFAPHAKSTATVEASKSVEVRLEAKKREGVEQPALGQTDGAFARGVKERREMNCGVTDLMGRDEFMLHMCGFCGCGRKDVMTPGRRE